MSRRVLPAIVLLLTASSVRAQCPAQTPELLTIERAIDIAIDQNRDGRNAAVDVERTRGETAVTNTKRWPAMTVNLLESMLVSQMVSKRPFAADIDSAACATPPPLQYVHLRNGPRRLRGFKYTPMDIATTPSAAPAPAPIPTYELRLTS
jgi:hypothetical protein